MLISRALRLRPGDVVALTGGGGKTTIMFRLAAELVSQGRTVITTMTTKIFVGQLDLAPAHLAYTDEATLLAALPQALERHGHVLLGGSVLVEEGKVQGLSPGVIDAIAARGLADAVIVEADGSRRLPLKAPAAHEPVIPQSATIVAPVAGLDAVGQLLAPETVHRAERVAALSGRPLGAMVTPDLMAAVLSHPDGGAKGLPPGARLVPFLNKADTPAALDAGQEAARLLVASPAVDSVVLGAAATEAPAREVWSRTGAVVLAAGQGKRFGGLKQVQPWQGKPLVAHVAAQALACPDIQQLVACVGAEAGIVTAAVRQAGELQVVQVPHWAEGQSRSVRAGLAALRGCSAALFLLADQPSVTPDLISALVRRHRETLAPIVAPRYRGQRGNPVLFDRATFAEFAALEGDIGARPVIERHRDEIAWVDWPSPDILSDIDTPADYDAAR